MSVTQVVRDSTVVEHAKVAAQQKRRMFIVQLEVNAYDEASSKLRPGLTRILEGIEEAGWRLELITPSESGESQASRLFIFRPDTETQKAQAPTHAEAQQPQQPQDQSGQQPAYPHYPTGAQQPDPYAGHGQGYGQPQQYPGYDQQQYPGYGQQQPGYG